jgi:hypothetical protein
MRAINSIVVHTAGSFDMKHRAVVHQPVGVVRAYHKMPVAAFDEQHRLIPGTGGKGWSDIGYHQYIERDGTKREGRAAMTMGAHVEGFNAHSLGVCCSGSGDHETFNPMQLASLVETCGGWMRLYNVSLGRVLGHHETDDAGGPPVHKTCPGTLVDMEAIRELVFQWVRTHG